MPLHEQYISLAFGAVVLIAILVINGGAVVGKLHRPSEKRTRMLSRP
jgi:hypothetical protein